MQLSDIMLHPLWDAIAWALLHFLWQGTIVAVLLAIALNVFGRASAQRRYAMSIGALVLMLALPVVTTMQIYLAAQGSGNGVLNVLHFSLEGSSESISSAASNGETANSMVSTNPDEAISEAPLTTWRTWMVGGWIGGVCLLAIYFLGGWLRLTQVKWRSLPLVEARWVTLCDAVQRRLGIHASVRFHTSEAIDQPMMMGWLRPMVLLPAGLLAGISVQHLEAILIHELVHIRRHDYLVLMLQSTMEVLLFYHPAVWWLSSKLRAEREYSCDEAVLSFYPDRLAYANALATVESERVQRFGLTLGARDGKLVDRIRQILQSKKPGLPASVSWRAIMACVFCVGILLSSCGQPDRAEAEQSAEELYAVAIQHMQNEELEAGFESLKKATRKGHFCANQSVIEVYGMPTRYRFNEDGSPKLEWAWFKPDHDSLDFYSKLHMAKMRVRAEEGEATAMLWLSYHYKGWWLNTIEGEENDSLANYWLDKAIEAGHPQAMVSRGRGAALDGDFESSEAFFAQAISAGYDPAYEAWAGTYLYSTYGNVDPEQYFRIADMAITSRAAGIHKWLQGNLDALNEQVALGNPEAIHYKEIADRLDIENRLDTVRSRDYDPLVFTPGACKFMRDVIGEQSD